MVATPLLLLALQQWSLGPTLSAVADGGKGVQMDCGGSYSTGLGMRVSTPAFLRHHVSLQLSGHDYWMGGGACMILRALPADGTRIEDDNLPLLGQPFVATDVKLSWSFVHDIASLSLGAGNAWRPGRDVPYVVIGGAADIPNSSQTRVGFSIEDQLLRVTSDRYLRTFQNHQLVAQQSLGPVHTLGHAVIVAFHVLVPF